MINDKSATRPRTMSLKSYKKMKVEALSDFCITLTDQEQTYMNSLKTEIAVDNFYISKIKSGIQTHI
jgi:hypothetical protein